MSPNVRENVPSRTWCEGNRIYCLKYFWARVVRWLSGYSLNSWQEGHGLDTQVWQSLCFLCIVYLCGCSGLPTTVDAVRLLGNTEWLWPAMYWYKVFLCASPGYTYWKSSTTSVLLANVYLQKPMSIHFGKNYELQHQKEIHNNAHHFRTVWQTVWLMIRWSHVDIKCLIYFSDCLC